MEKTVIKTATKKLKEYVDENGGCVKLNVSSANKWMEENGIDFEIKPIIEDNQHKLEIKTK